MTDRPILFSAPMVRSLIAGAKTQTRRVLSNNKFASIFNGEWSDSYVLDPCNAGWRDREIRYAVGDRLWVREAWKAHSTFEGIAPRDIPPSTIFYLADNVYAPSGSRGRPGMFMPRWASRLTLIVTDVRVQRLQDITEGDSRREGVEVVQRSSHIAAIPYFRNYDPAASFPTTGSGRESFRTLWNSLNADRGFGWETNPWVVAVGFEVKKGNIDG